MGEPDNRGIEVVVAYSEFEDKLKAIGLNFDVQLAYWDKTSDVKVLSVSSDPIAKQRVVQAAILADGTTRLMESKKTVCPSNADLNPQNARMVFSRGSVFYGRDQPFELDVFSQFDEIFKVEKK